MSATSALLDHCTPEKIAEVKRRFGRIDLNGDGFVDHNEVVAELRRSFYGADEDLIAAAAAQVVKKADKDGDGKIDLHEFLATFDEPGSPIAMGFMTGLSRPSSSICADLARSMVSQLSAAQIEELHAAFNESASDGGDGFLPPSQVEGALRAAFYGADDEIITDAAAYIVDTAARGPDGRIDVKMFFDFFENAGQQLRNAAVAPAPAPPNRSSSPPPKRGSGSDREIVQHLTAPQRGHLLACYGRRNPGMPTLSPIVDRAGLDRVIWHLFPGAEAGLIRDLSALVVDVADISPESDGSLLDITDLLEAFPPPAGADEGADAAPVLLVSHPSQRKGTTAPSDIEFANIAQHLPPSDLKHLQGDFHRIDLDGDGYVDEHELHQMLRGAFRNPDDRLVDRLTGLIIDVADRDGDGRIDMKEFTAAFGPNGSLAGARGIPPMAIGTAGWDSDVTSSLAVLRPKAAHGASPRASQERESPRASRSRQPLSDDLVFGLLKFFRAAEGERYRTATSAAELHEILSAVFDGAPPELIDEACESLQRDLARTGRGHIAVGSFFEELREMIGSQSLVLDAADTGEPSEGETNVLAICGDSEKPNEDDDPSFIALRATEAVEVALSRDERDLLRDVFIALDTDGDGLIDRTSVLAAAQRVLTESRFTDLKPVLEQEFSGADLDADDRLNLLEFTASFATGTGVLPQDVLLSAVADVRVRLSDEEISTLVENFRVVDADSDGLLDPDELFAGLRDIFAGGFDDDRYETIVTAVLRAADRDGDGRLSVSEFIRSFQEDQGVLPPTFAQTRVDMMLGLLGPDLLGIIAHHVRDLERVLRGPADFNKVQRLLRQRVSPSITAAFQQKPHAVTEQVVRWLLSTADRDGDGRVSLASFVDMYDAQQRLLEDRPEEDRKLASAEGSPARNDPPTSLLATVDQEVAAPAAADTTASGPGKRSKVFATLDTNEDGLLDAGDMVPLLEALLRGTHPEWPPDAITKAAQSVFASAAGEGNGQLDLAGFQRSFEHGYGVLPDEYVDRVARKSIVRFDEGLTDTVIRAIAAVDDAAPQGMFDSKQQLLDQLRAAVAAVLPAGEVATVNAVADIVAPYLRIDEDTLKATLGSFLHQAMLQPQETLQHPLNSHRERVVRGLLHPPRSRASSFHSDKQSAAVPQKSLTDMAFDALDVNSSGYLERNELEPLLFNVVASEHPDWGPTAVQNAATAAFNLADLDGDGRIGREEWQASFDNDRPLIPQEQADGVAMETLTTSPTISPAPSRIAPKEAHNLTYVFSRFDTDRDGFVTIEELRNGLSPVLRHRNPKWTADQVEVATRMFMNAADRDRDGRLALGEFIASFRSGAPVLPLEVVTHAVLFQSSQAEGRRQLSSVEVEQLRAAFNDIDINKDGNISAKELLQLLAETSSLPEGVNADSIVGGIINFADNDADGEVSFDEFLSAFENDSTLMRVPVMAARDRIARAEGALANILAEEEMRKIARVFVDLDKDKNGVLDFDELHDEMFSMMAAMHPEWESLTIENAVRAVFDAADVNHDGQLSLEEFISTFANKHYVLPPSWLEERSNRLSRRLTSEEVEELKEVFHAIDVNNDGVLSTRELENLMRESLEGSMRGDTANINAIVAAVLHVVDTDNDGCVSFGEFVEAYSRDTTVLDIPIMAAAARREVAERRMEVMLCEHDMRDLAKVFLHLDVNGDGFLSQEALGEAMLTELSKSHPEWSDDRLKSSVNSLLASADINHDGRLSLDEFIATFVAGHYVLPPQFIKEVVAKMARKLSEAEMQELQSIFRAIDKKGDGFVTPQQIRQSVEEAVDEQTAEAIVNTIMLVADENNDGCISMEEFVRCYELDNGLLTIPISSISHETAARIAAKLVPKEKVRQYGILFNAIDSKRDGFLDLEELADGIIGLVSPGADREGVEAVAKAKLLQADLDGDHKLDLDEFVASFTNPYTVFFPDDAVAIVAVEARKQSPAATPDPTRSPLRNGAKTEASPASSEEPRVSNATVVPAEQAAASPERPPAAKVEAGDEQEPTEQTPPPRAVVQSKLSPTPPTTKKAVGRAATRSPMRNVANVAVFDDELHEQFERYDSNGNGFLDVVEFRRAYAAMENFGLPLSDKELERIFAPYAPNGRLSYEAFCIVMLKRSRM